MVWWFGRRDRSLVTPWTIVLGARVFSDGTPSPVLVRRAAQAAALWRAEPDRRLILSGGSPDARPTEAAAMARLLRAGGIPAEALHLETASRSTEENARECIRYLRVHGVQQANLVSDRFHLLRARQLFRREGMDAGTVGVDPGDMPRFDRLYWVMREGLALLARPALLFQRRPGS